MNHFPAPNGFQNPNAFPNPNILHFGVEDLGAIDELLQRHFYEFDQQIRFHLGELHEYLQADPKEAKMGTALSRFSGSNTLSDRQVELTHSRGHRSRQDTAHFTSNNASAYETELDELRTSLHLAYEERKKQIHELENYEQRFQASEDTHATMRRRIRELDDINNQLEREKKVLVASEQELKQAKENMSIELGDLQDKNHSLRAQNQQLRELIVKPTSELINDNTVVTNFVDLREQIQRISFKFYSINPPLQADLRHLQLTKRQQAFFAAWKDELSVPVLQSRVRYMMFSILRQKILSQPIFGLEGLAQGDLEHSLGQFEHALSKVPTGHEADIVEWRTHTLKCAALLDAKHKTAADTARDMEDFMAPPRPRDRSDAAQKADTLLHDRMGKLCEDAYKLMLTLRRCKDTYRCEMSGAGVKVEAADVEPLFREHPGNTTGASQEPAVAKEEAVCFTIFGSLVKYPENNMAKRLVLEKAHVVVR